MVLAANQTAADLKSDDMWRIIRIAPLPTTTRPYFGITPGSQFAFLSAFAAPMAKSLSEAPI